MYMNVYNVSEFRKDIKEALDKSVHGEDVRIKRSGVEFRVVAVLPGKDVVQIPQVTTNGPVSSIIPQTTPSLPEVDQPKGLVKKGDVIDSQPKLKAVGMETKRTERVNPPNSRGLALCKHGANPKLCRFAKPGKECK